MVPCWLGVRGDRDGGVAGDRPGEGAGSGGGHHSGEVCWGQGQEFAEFVRILVWGGEGEGWREVRDKETKSVVIRANRDTHSKVEIVLEEPVITRMVRIVPVSKHPRMVCLRVELLGCDIQGNLKQIFFPGVI